jgi:hypothetical protein
MLNSTGRAEFQIVVGAEPIQVRQEAELQPVSHLYTSLVFPIHKYCLTVLLQKFFEPVLRTAQF